MEGVPYVTPLAQRTTWERTCVDVRMARTSWIAGWWNACTARRYAGARYFERKWERKEWKGQDLHNKMSDCPRIQERVDGKRSRTVEDGKGSVEEV